MTQATSEGITDREVALLHIIAKIRQATGTESAMLYELPDALKSMREALDQSVKLQSHYASLLNVYDGGKRMQFASAEEWIARLSALVTKPK